MKHLPRQGTLPRIIVKHTTISNKTTSSSSSLTDTPVSQTPQDNVAVTLPSSTATPTTNTMTNVLVDASTKSPSQLRREEIGRQLKKGWKFFNEK